MYINKVLYIFISNFFTLSSIKRLYSMVIIAKIDNKKQSEGEKE